MTSIQSSPANLRFRLRDATAEAHQKVEAAMALTERCADRDSYLALLSALWGLYAPLESQLASLRWDGLGIDFDQRAKTPWLHADLTMLGLSTSDIAALPRALDLPSIQCPADGFGVLYVLEGASLGGQIILRQIKSRLGLTEHAGARFFASYGAEVGEYWRRFVAAMAAYGETEPRAKAIERAALATFDCFLHWIDDGSVRSNEDARNVR